MFNNEQISLTEATVLALQGKLKIQEDAKRVQSKRMKKESVNINVDDAGNTTVDTEEATVTVNTKKQEAPLATEPQETIDVPVEGDETIVPEEEVDKDEFEGLDESKKVERKSLKKEAPAADYYDNIESGSYRSNLAKSAPVVNLADKYISSVIKDSINQGILTNRNYLDISMENISKYISDEAQYWVKTYGIDEDMLNKIESTSFDNRRCAEIFADKLSDDKYTLENIQKGGKDYIRVTVKNAKKDEGRSLKKESKFSEDDLNEILDILDEEYDEAQNNPENSPGYIYGDIEEKIEDMSIDNSIKNRILGIISDFSDYDTALYINQSNIFECIYKIRDYVIDQINKKESKKVERISLKKESKPTFNKKSFEEALTRFYRFNSRKVESFEVKSVATNSKGLKVEGYLVNKENKVPATMIFNKKTEGKTYTKYTLANTNGILKESKDITTNLMVSTLNNELNCKYVISK